MLSEVSQTFLLAHASDFPEKLRDALKLCHGQDIFRKVVFLEKTNQRRSSESHCYHFIGTTYFYCEHHYFEKHCRAVPPALR